MTHTTETLIDAALSVDILVMAIAAVVLIKKTFGGRLGFRFKDRVWSTLDDHGERLAVVEMTLEQLRPKTQTGDLGPVTERNTPPGVVDYNHGLRDGRKEEIRRVLGILAKYHNVIDLAVFEDLHRELSGID